MKRETIKVAHIITLLEFGGAQQNTLYTVSHLNKTLFEPILIAGKGAYLDNEIFTKNNYKTVFVPHLKRSPCPFFDIIAFIHLIIILRNIKPHIVHTHSSKAGILGRWAAFFARVPAIIHTYHGFGFHEYQNRLIHHIYVLFERLTALITDKLICVSSANISYALSKQIAFPLKYHLIRSGIQLDLYSNKAINAQYLKNEFNIDNQDKVIIMTACFKPQKNCRDFIKLAGCVASKTNDKKIKFILIGDGTQRSMLESEIREYKLGDFCFLPGWRKDVPALLHISDVFVLTSLWEGLPRAVVEALVSGVPVFANRVDGVQDVIQDGFNGYMFEPFNVNKMAEKIIQVLYDQKLYKTLASNAAGSISADFEIDNMVGKQEMLYQKVINC